jgi:small neutral amino acid transporter SnatA (MarC family)
MEQTIGILGQAVLVLTALVIICFLFYAFLIVSRAIVRFLKELSRI